LAGEVGCHVDVFASCAAQQQLDSGDDGVEIDHLVLGDVGAGEGQ
jgi:hypothetical protein